MPATPHTSAVPASAETTVFFTSADPAMSLDALSRDVDIINLRIASEGLLGVTAGINPDGKGVVVHGPSADKDKLQMLGRSGVLGFRPVLAATDAKSTGGAGGPAPQGVSAALWQQLAALDCKKTPVLSETADAQIVACDTTGTQKYVLDATAVDGKSITAAAAAPNSSGNWQVNVSLNSVGAAQFEKLTSKLAGTGGLFAITVDGIVYSAPTVQQPITDGNGQITGTFTETSAQNLAAVLKNGELPAALDLSSVTG